MPIAVRKTSQNIIVGMEFLTECWNGFLFSDSWCSTMSYRNSASETLPLEVAYQLSLAVIRGLSGQIVVTFPEVLSLAGMVAEIPHPGVC